MSSLFPDESYCNSDLGRIAFQLKTDWECKAYIKSTFEEKHLAGSHTVYNVEVECTCVHPMREYKKFIIPTRYKEMQKLYFGLSKLHKQLYLRGNFPSFPAAKLIGSLEPTVVNERKAAIECVLNFVFDSEVLRKARIFQDFLDKGYHFVQPATPNEITIDNSQNILDLPIEDPDFHRDVQLPSQNCEESQYSAEELASTTTSNSAFQFPDIEIAGRVDANVSEDIKKIAHMKRFLPKIRKKSTNSSTSNDSGKSDYLVKAGQLVATAQRAEEENAFELAFQCYKNAASNLIQGAHIESDIARRNVIRRKTAKYLVKAEKLYKTYLSLDGSVFNFESLLTTAMQDPNILAFQCSNKIMKNYRFIGVLPELNASNKVLLVEEGQTGSKYVMKLIEKGTPDINSRIFLPSNIPHMVQLIHFFEIENHIVLLLEHIEPGRLWTFLDRYFDECEAKHVMHLADMKPEVRDGEKVSEINIDVPNDSHSYRGKRLLFTVGIDYERVVQMRDETTSSETPSEETVICTMGEDATGIAQAPAGDFGLVGYSREREDEEIHVQEEAPAEINLSTRKICRGNRLQHDEIPTTSTSTVDDNTELSFSQCLKQALDDVKKCLDSENREWTQNDIPECLVVHWCAQIVSFFYVLHHEHMEYIGNVNSDNLLIDNDGNLLITYYGKWYDSEKTQSLFDGYSAPEAYEYGWTPTAESDIWTIGALMFELICGRSLANAAPHGVHRNAELPFPEEANISFAAMDLLSTILVPTPALRPSLDSIRMHVFFHGINWSLYDNPTTIATEIERRDDNDTSDVGDGNGV